MSGDTSVTVSEHAGPCTAGNVSDAKDRNLGAEIPRREEVGQ
jgi:hypothetical protein